MDPRYKSPTVNVDIETKDDFRDLETFTNVLRWMLWIGAFLAALSLTSSWLQLNLLSRSYTPEEGSANDLREHAVVGLTLLYFIATAIVFGRWIVLAHRNVQALGVSVIEFAPGWAVGWFFVPVVNIWFPYRAMRFLWRASHSAQRPDIQDSTWVLPVWWGLWLGGWFLSRIVSGLERTADTVPELIAMTEWAMVSVMDGLALYIVASILVVRIWEAQRAQRENPGKFDPPAGFAG